jgi:hypothetical protein
METTNATNDYVISTYTLDSEPDLSDVELYLVLSDIQITEQEVLDQFQILNITK